MRWACPLPTALNPIFSLSSPCLRISCGESLPHPYHAAVTPPTPYRLIALDLDGTLLSPTGEVTPRARAAVHACLDAGYAVCFATGRNHTESRAVIEAVGHFDAAVFVGGATVVDTRTGLTLHRTAIDPALAADLCGFVESMGHAPIAMQDAPPVNGESGTEGGRKVDYFLGTAVEPHWSFLGWAESKGLHHLAEPRLSDPAAAGEVHAHTVRVGVICALSEGPSVRGKLKERFGERVYLHGIRVHYADVEVIEIFDPSVNKWAGIQKVAETRGIGGEQIVAVGDDLNDLHMIERAGLGVAMGNAQPEVIAAADARIAANVDEGLAAFLEGLAAGRVDVMPIERGDAGA